MEIVHELAAVGPGTRSTVVQVLGAALLFYALEVFVLKGPLSSWLRKVFGQNQKLSPRQVEYAVTQAACRIVGSVHFLIQIPLALMVIYSPEMTNRYGRLYATNGLTRSVLTVSAGYFLYDAVVCLVRYEGMPFLVHGVFASILYTYGALSGYLGYYAALFVLWEISTPFVYIRWFLHTLGRSKSREYMINGFAMMAAFFLCRNVVGSLSSYEFWDVSGRELLSPALDALHKIPPFILWGIRMANCVFMTLNTMWFAKMVRGALALVGGRPHKGGPGDIEQESSESDGLEYLDGPPPKFKAKFAAATVPIFVDASGKKLS
eukprot:jgi/Botrbrau1/5396/Bobra.182_1s0001.2